MKVIPSSRMSTRIALREIEKYFTITLDFKWGAGRNKADEKKQKDRYFCRNCGEELESIIEVGVNDDIMACMLG